MNKVVEVITINNRQQLINFTLINVYSNKPNVKSPFIILYQPCSVINHPLAESKDGIEDKFGVAFLL